MDVAVTFTLPAWDANAALSQAHRIGIAIEPSTSLEQLKGSSCHTFRLADCEAGSWNCRAIFTTGTVLEREFKMIGRIVTKISRYEIEGWLHIPLNACGENTRPKETRQWHDKNPN